jgi:hypothetical protein
MQLLNMRTTDGTPPMHDAAHAAAVDGILQMLSSASEDKSPADFETAIRAVLMALETKTMVPIRQKLKSYSSAELRVLGHVLYSYSKSETDHQPLATASSTVPFYVETTPTAVNFIGEHSDAAIYGVLNATLTNEYFLLLGSGKFSPSTAMALGRAAVMCRSINGGIPLAVGGIFHGKFVSPYSGTMTFDDLAWIGNQESLLVPHAAYLRQHKTCERHFIERLLSGAQTPHEGA